MHPKTLKRLSSPPRLAPLAAILVASLAMPALALESPWARGRILEVQRLDASRGWVLTDSELLWTQDGGASWTPATPARGLDQTPSMSLLDDRLGWLAGVDAQHPDRLAVLGTTDGGRSWASLHVASRLERDERYTRAQVFFADAQHGWLLGQVATGSAFSMGRLFRTADGGKTWESLPQPPAAGRLFFEDASRGFMTGAPVAEKLHVTEDGGRTWREISLASGYALYGMPVFRSAALGSVAVTLPGETPKLAIFATRDGGRTWSPEASFDLPAGDYSEAVPVAFDSAGHLAAMAVEGGVVLGAGTEKPTFLGDASVRDLSFSGASGWALLAEGSCDSATCVQTTRLLALDATAAGGAMRDVLIRSLSEDRAGGVVTPMGSTISLDKGFDKCSAGTTSQMQTWKTYSPYKDANIYYGGNSRACSQPNLTSGWVSAVFTQGWRLIPTWVGPQAPCTTYPNRFSTDPTTARNQGLAEGDAAVNAASALGLGSGTPLYYDLENYNETITSCTNGVRAFINAYVERVRSRGYIAGVYGNAYDAAHDWRSGIIANVPDAVWIASWVCSGGTTCSWTPTVWGIPGLSDSYWTNNQRIRQYWGQHNDTYGGVTFAVDSNYANAPVATGGGGGGGTFTCDDGDGCFGLYGPSQYWHRETLCGGSSVGYGGDVYWTYVNGTVTSNYVRWTPNFSGTGGAGNYVVSVYIPRCYGTSLQAKYRIYHNGVSDYATVNQNAVYDAWVTLGTYYFANNGTEYLELTDATGEAYSTMRQIAFDAARFVK